MGRAYNVGVSSNIQARVKSTGGPGRAYPSFMSPKIALRQRDTLVTGITPRMSHEIMGELVSDGR